MLRNICINVLLFTCIITFSQNYVQKNFKEIHIDSLSIIEEGFYTILDSVMNSERNCRYYGNSVSYSIRVYKAKKNLIKIEGSDNEWLFLESKDLNGYFKYQGHNFFLLSECNEIFSKSISQKVIKGKEVEIVEDDRWPIYYFGFDSSNFYFYKRTNFTPK